MAQKPTLKSIAFATGLAVTTVSRALKDAPDIGEKTKQRVRLAAEQIGYRPNRAGVRLRTGKTSVIALILDAEDKIMNLSPYLAYGISEVVSRANYHLIVIPYKRGGDPLEPVRYVVDTGAADGLIFLRTEAHDARVHYLMEHAFPFVTYGRTDMGVVHAYHDFDNETYAREAVHRMSQRGRRRFALLEPPSSLTYHRHMVKGFLEGVAQVDGVEVPFSGVNIDSELKGIQARVAQAMSGSNRPDALVCGSTPSALASAAGIEAAGLTIGRDIDLATKQVADVLSWFGRSFDVANQDVDHASQQLGHAILAIIDGEDPATLQSLSYPEWAGPAPTAGGRL